VCSQSRPRTGVPASGTYGSGRRREPIIKRRNLRARSGSVLAVERTLGTMLVVLALTACAGEPQRDTPSADRSTVEPVPVPAPPPPAPVLRTPGALRGSPWMFYDPIGPLGCGLFGGGASADCDPHFVGDPRVYHVRAGRLVREDDGQVVFDVALGEPPGASELVVSLAIERAELCVAGVIDGDLVVLLRSADDGSVLSDHRVAHVGSPATRVQIESIGDGITFHALAERPWSARLDPHDGALLDRAEVGVSLGELSPDAPGRAWVPARASAEAGEVVARRSHVRSTGEHTWDVTIADPFRCGAYALAVLETEVAVVRHCPASSGAQLTFLDRGDGSVVAELLGGTIGSIGHSMYRSEVDVARSGDLLFVRGRESGGSYVCVASTREHRSLACSIQRR
jgi:hypothetical protein